ncbi:MAG TPA: hypothetical protein VKE96_05445 [Vicinamibacterales bacterium]|nr:hypothetical protein [Vicinamibacterales bacterium]
MAHSRPASTPGDDVPAPLVRAELDRLLASELFARSPRLSSFLKFIVEKTLAGEGESLKEHVIAVELYGKAADFNTAEDPIVRIDARRLRDKLREYYAGPRDAAIVISVPKGSYTPVFDTSAAASVVQLSADGSTVADSAAVAAPVVAPLPAASVESIPRWWLIAGTALGMVIVGLLWLVVSQVNDRSEPARLLTVTALPGSEEDPSLSPDGRFVVFSWTGPPPSTKSDIWIKSVDGEAMRNLTNTLDIDEKWPQWSPDGQWIAFSRSPKDRPVVVKVSPLGGPEQTIAEHAYEAAWTPDTRGLVMHWEEPGHPFAIIHQVLETGTRRQLTRPPVGFSDIFPRVSPDGTTLAFVRSGGGRSAVFLVPMAGGEPALFGEWSGGVVGGIEWMPDGRELLVTRPASAGRRLMRVPVHARRPEVPVPGFPYESVGPSISRVGTGSGYRLAVASGQPDVGLRLVDLGAPREGTTITADAPFCDATRADAPGRFSPDGSQVAFTSNRSGAWQVWVARRDGSDLRPVTGLQDAAVSLGSWSPDGHSLTFDATTGDRTDVYIVALNAGTVTRLTDGTANATDPEWSRDGRWIYFSSNQSGEPTIWRVAATGGGLTQLTTDIGFDPHQSPDGRSLYFIGQPRFHGLDGRTALMRVSVDGGPAEVVDVTVMPGAWDVTDTGIVYVADRIDAIAAGKRGANTLEAYDFKDHRIRTIGQLAFVVGPFASSRFLTVSRDGRWALASHIDRWERDILVLDGFR